MRAEAVAAGGPTPTPEYRAGRGEATGLPDGVAAAVLAAQAFHWLESSSALREFHRILRPGGWAALMWNERDEADPFTAAYGSVIDTALDAAALEVARGRAGEPLLTSPLFENAFMTPFAHRQELDEEGLMGRSFSASYAPRELAAAEAWRRGLRDVFARWQRNDRVVLHYRTTVYLGRRAS